MYVKKSTGYVLKNTFSNVQNNSQDSLKKQNLLRYYSHFLKTVYLIQSKKGHYKMVELDNINISNDAFLDALKVENIKMYKFCCEYNACETCAKLDGKIFEISSIQQGKNYPPMHPNCRCIKEPYIFKQNYLFKLTFKEWLDQYVNMEFLHISKKELLTFMTKSDKKALNEILDRQYTAFAPKDFQKIVEEVGAINDRVMSYLLSQNLLSRLADARMEKDFKSIESNKNDIIEISHSFGIPPEYVAPIILKEQYTQSIPDNLAIILRKLDLTRGSTGLGAISAPTARARWNYYNKEQAKKLLPKDDVDLLKKLATDNKFNIKTICVVLVYEAHNLGIGGKDDMTNLSKKDWHKIYNKYNGDIEYANKTIAYVPYMGGLLY